MTWRERWLSVMPIGAAVPLTFLNPVKGSTPAGAGQEDCRSVST